MPINFYFYFMRSSMFFFNLRNEINILPDVSVFPLFLNGRLYQRVLASFNQPCQHNDLTNCFVQHCPTCVADHLG